MLTLKRSSIFQLEVETSFCALWESQLFFSSLCNSFQPVSGLLFCFHTLWHTTNHLSTHANEGDQRDVTCPTLDVRPFLGGFPPTAHPVGLWHFDYIFKLFFWQQIFIQSIVTHPFIIFRMHRESDKPLNLTHTWISTSGPVSCLSPVY